MDLRDFIIYVMNIPWWQMLLILLIVRSGHGVIAGVMAVYREGKKNDGGEEE